MSEPDANELREHLHAAAGDLERLQALLADACDTLLARFSLAADQLAALPLPPDDRAWPPLRDARTQLGAAVTALQFQDMASQLIAHAQRRLHQCAERVGAPPGAGAHARVPPPWPNPVAQANVASGPIELF